MAEVQILDTPISGVDSAYNAKDHLAGSGKRFLNLLIDAVAYYLLAAIAGVILALTGNLSVATGPLSSNVIAFFIILLYYIVMEATTGATLGKLLTKTRVVTEQGEKPSFGQIVGRSFARLIPFDAFSFLGGNPGWHDNLSATFVVKKDD
jgi:uncharacterized RDD family membrane protein YckC